MGDEDVLGVIDVLLPGEREALRGPLSELVDELRRLEVLARTPTLGDRRRRLRVEDVSVDVEATNVDDIANLTIEATVTGPIDGEELPVGDWIRDELGDGSLSSTRPTPPRRHAPRHGRAGGRPLVPQPVLHVGESAARRPATPTSRRRVSRRSAATARRRRWTSSSTLSRPRPGGDVAALDPDEMQALQRYAPLFLDDAQAELDEPSSTFDRQSLVRGRGQGDTRSVVLDGVTVEATAEGDTVSMELRDGCWIVNAGRRGDRLVRQRRRGACARRGLRGPAGDRGLPGRRAGGLRRLREPRLVVREVDGSWYLSPIATGTEQLLASSGPSRGRSNACRHNSTTSPRSSSSWSSDRRSRRTTVRTSADPAEECWIESDADGRQDVLRRPGRRRRDRSDLQSLGTCASPSAVSPISVGTATTTRSPTRSSPPRSPTPRRASRSSSTSGEADELDLPVELLHPDCLFGRNWYTTTDDDYLKEFEDCAFG